MSRSDVPKAHNIAWVNMDGYEWVEFGDRTTARVVNYPWCPHGCRKFAGKGKPAPRVRLVRVWNNEYEHYSLKCWKCKRVISSWA